MHIIVMFFHITHVIINSQNELTIHLLMSLDIKKKKKTQPKFDNSC